MCGYTDYSDPRLQPPDEAEMTPTECHESCIHANACKRIYEYEVGELLDAALELGCGDCDEYDDGAWMQRRCRERIDALRSACVALVQRCRVGEDAAEIELIDARFAHKLTALGIEVDE